MRYLVDTGFCGNQADEKEHESEDSECAARKLEYGQNRAQIIFHELLDVKELLEAFDTFS